jgi:hypothetical protein
MKITNRILVIALAVLCFSCEDVLENDITNDLVQAVYPTENAVIESNVVTFQWNILDGADDYRIQVYNTNQIMVFDTLVNSYNVVLPLTEGIYQWRVRGENSAYQSAYTFPITFEVDESLDLTSQLVILSSPVNGFVTNQNNFTLAWETLGAADSYTIEILNTTGGGTIVYQQSGIITTSITLNNTIITQDAQYTWKVKGVNTTSETAYASRNFSIDTVLPNQPQNSLPAHNSTQIINQNVNFSWTIPADSGTVQSTISYVIEIASDTAFTNILQTSNATGTTFQQTFTSTGDYYWRVRAKDAAGNIGTNSSYFKFTIN